MPEPVSREPIGPHVRKLRENKGWSLTRLADEAGISRSYLAQIEYGESTPTAEKIYQLADALGVFPSELLGEHPEEKVVPESLRQFAEQEDLEPQDIQMLAQIELRGKRPSTVEEWKAIYSVISAFLEDR